MLELKCKKKGQAYEDRQKKEDRQIEIKAMVKSRNGFPNMFVSKDLQYREMRWVGGNRKHEEARCGNE